MILSAKISIIMIICVPTTADHVIYRNALLLNHILAIRKLIMKINLKIVAAAAFLLIISEKANAQLQEKKEIFTHADTLRGTDGPFRQQWDVLHYEITVKPDFTTKTIEGKNELSFFDNGAKLMQIDLQEPMILDSVTNEGHSYKFRREENVYWLEYRDSSRMYKIKPGIRSLTFYFHGKPKEAIKPPWDGGWIWKKDKKGNPWMTVACQGLGASVWYPCKDLQSDKPDSGATLHIIAPDSLVAVGNGRLTDKHSLGNGTTIYTWNVKNPINNYCIVPYIGKYVTFSEKYAGLKGPLDMDYWVIDYNLEKAKAQFTDAPKMMKAFEYWFGPYPFYDDGYKLVDAPMLGMEHQSAIAYGNDYRKGYYGKDLSGSGQGMKWDFIVVHESGHEWFANSVCSKDIADMWIHEGFTNYSEELFTEYYWGKAAGEQYLEGLRQNISNDIPVIGPYGVNKEGSGDMYYKGSNMLHLIRQLTTDKKFRAMLLDLQKTYYHKTVTTQEIEAFISKKLKLDLAMIFHQYLRTTMVPTLEYRISGREISYHWTNVVAGLNLPIKVLVGNKVQRITPSNDWKKLKAPKSFDGKAFSVDKNYYVLVKEVIS
jgi:aminopeptidase N